MGTGTGNFAIKLARKGLIVSAGDISENLISLTNYKAKQSGVNIDTFCCSASDMVFPPNKVVAIFRMCFKTNHANQSFG